jgi:hypothetical protein
MSAKAVALGPPATLAEVLELIAAMDDLPRQKRHDLMSAVRRTAMLLDSLPVDIPADPAALRRRLSPLTPARCGHDQEQVEERSRSLNRSSLANRLEGRARATSRRPGSRVARSA